ncbi:MAG TPA: DUF4038 domain-containing protein [Methylobacter sp.]
MQSPIDIIYPLKVSTDSRSALTPLGRYFFIALDSAWYSHFNLNPTDQATYLADRLSKGFNAITAMAIEHKFSLNKPPLDFVSNLPFTKQLGGSTYTGSPNGTTSVNGNSGQYAADNYSNANTQSPDFTYPNSAYWDRLVTFIDSRYKEGILVLLFPCYIGFAGGDEGWMVELSANDAVTGAGGLAGQPYVDASKSKAWNYGAFIATRFAPYPNILWIMGGDYGSGGNSGIFTTGQKTAVDNLMQGMKSVGGTRSILFTAHWSRGSLASSVTLTNSFDLESVYTDTTPANECRSGWSNSPAAPAFNIENEYESAAAGSAPYRKYQWWSVTCGSGLVYGQDGANPLYFFRSGWQSQLSTQTALDVARLIIFIQSLPWWTLVPSGLVNGAFTQKNIITANGSTSGQQDYISATADAAGTTCVAYIPPAWALTNFTVDMTVMRGTTTAQWFDPTNGTYTLISSSLVNTGTHTFTPPGTNSAGDTDWVLLMTS